MQRWPHQLRKTHSPTHLPTIVANRQWQLTRPHWKTRWNTSTKSSTIWPSQFIRQKVNNSQVGTILQPRKIPAGPPNPLQIRNQANLLSLMHNHIRHFRVIIKLNSNKSVMSDKAVLRPFSNNLTIKMGMSLWIWFLLSLEDKMKYQQWCPTTQTPSTKVWKILSHKCLRYSRIRRDPPITPNPALMQPVRR